MSSSSTLPRIASTLVAQSFGRSFFSNSTPTALSVGQLRFYANSKDDKVLHPDLLNALVLKTQYAVRGELYLRAEELRKAGKEIIFTNGEFRPLRLNRHRPLFEVLTVYSALQLEILMP